MQNKSIKILSPAKINWFLNVKNSAHNGYHQLQTVMQKINLHDVIYIESIDENIIDFYDYNNKCFCLPEKNIIVKAALKLQNIFNVDSGLFISIEKNIPVCAGLGGGSSNAAAVLNALIKLWDIKISDDELNEIAASLGADVPFFLKTTAGLCEGIGEKINPLIPKKYNVVLWKQGSPLSTRDVYKQFDQKDRAQKNAGEFLDAYSSEHLLEMVNQIWNNLAFAAEELNPELRDMKNECLESGAVASWVSGSGPTVVSLCETADKAEELAGKLKQNHPVDFVCVCETLCCL
jgi:4-diphosphocytidyl-2-C-methyl-D-erythritol kinase